MNWHRYSCITLAVFSLMPEQPTISAVLSGPMRLYFCRACACEPCTWECGGIQSLSSWKAAATNYQLTQAGRKWPRSAVGRLWVRPGLIPTLESGCVGWHGQAESGCVGWHGQTLGLLLRTPSETRLVELAQFCLENGRLRCFLESIKNRRNQIPQTLPLSFHQR